MVITVSGIMKFLVSLGEVFLGLCFSYSWCGLDLKMCVLLMQIMLITVVPSSDRKCLVCELLSRDLAKVSAGIVYETWGWTLSKLEPLIFIIVISSLMDAVVTGDLFEILEILFDIKFTFTQHLHSIFSLVAQKVCLLMKFYKILGDRIVLLMCFNSVKLPSPEHGFSVYTKAMIKKRLTLTVFSFLLLLQVMLGMLDISFHIVGGLFCIPDVPY